MEARWAKSPVRASQQVRGFTEWARTQQPKNIHDWACGDVLCDERVSSEKK